MKMMKNNKLKFSKTIGLTFCFSLLVLVSCSKKDNVVVPEDPDPEEYDRTPLLTNYSNEYIKPAYTEYFSQVTGLKNEVTNFNTTLTVASLQSLRTKWENTLLVWQDVAFLEFGPAANISLRAQTNAYPVDTNLMKSNITSGTYSLAAGSNFDAKGFQALDYLLNGIETSDVNFISYYTNTPNARTYMQDVVDELEVNASIVKNEWQVSYSVSFIANSASNAQGSSVSNVINALTQHYETYLRKGKIGLPVGAFNGFSNQPMPEHVEGYYANQSLPYVYRSVTAFQNFIKGKGYVSASNGVGLDDYMSFVNAQNNGQNLHTVIDNQFNAIRLELDNINDPLSNEVTTNTSGVNAVYQKMQQMVGYIKVDMTNALEVLVTYQDSDGD
jgi:predicted lipoprotein